MEGKVTIEIDVQDDYKPFLYFTFNGKYKNWDSLDLSELKSDYDIVDKMYGLADEYNHLNPVNRYVDPETNSVINYDLKKAHTISKIFNSAINASLIFQYDEEQKLFSFCFNFRRKFRFVPHPSNIEKDIVSVLDADIESSSNRIEFESDNLQDAFTKMVATLSGKIPEMLEQSVNYTREFNNNNTNNVSSLIEAMTDGNFIKNVSSEDKEAIINILEDFMKKMGVKTPNNSKSSENLDENSRVDDFLSEFGEDK